MTDIQWAPWLAAGGTLIGGMVTLIRARDAVLAARASSDQRLDHVETRLSHLELQHREVLTALEGKASKQDLQDFHQDLKGDLREVRGILLGVLRSDV